MKRKPAKTGPKKPIAKQKPLSKAESERDYWKQQADYRMQEVVDLGLQVGSLKKLLLEKADEIAKESEQLAKWRDTVKLRDEKIGDLQLLVRDLTRDLQDLSGLSERGMLPANAKFKDVLEVQVKARKWAEEELKRVQATLRQATSECVQLRTDVSRLQAVVNANQTTSTQLHEARVERNRLAQELATAQCAPEQRDLKARLREVEDSLNNALSENRILAQAVEASKNHVGTNPPPFTASISVAANGKVTFSHNMTQQPAERPVYWGGPVSG